MLQPVTDPFTKFDGSFMFCNEIAKIKKILWVRGNMDLPVDDTDLIETRSNLHQPVASLTLCNLNP